MLRMLGGESYWPHGVESLRADALRRGASFAASPARLNWNRSSPRAAHSMQRDTERFGAIAGGRGGVEKAELALRFAAHLIGHGDSRRRRDRCRLRLRPHEPALS